MTSMKIVDSYEFIYDKDGAQFKKKMDFPSNQVNIYESWYSIDRKKNNRGALPLPLTLINSKELPKVVKFDLSANDPFSQSYFRRIYPSVKITTNFDKANYILCDNRTVHSYLKKYEYFEYYCHSDLLKKNIIQVDQLLGGRLSNYSFRIFEFEREKSQLLKDKIVYLDDFIDRFDGNRIKEMNEDDALNILRQVLSKSKQVRTLGAELICGYIPKFSPIISFILSTGRAYKPNRKLNYFLNRYSKEKIVDVESLDEWFSAIKKNSTIHKDINKILNKLISSEEFKSSINYKPKHFSYSSNLSLLAVDQNNLTDIENLKI